MEQPKRAYKQVNMRTDDWQTIKNLSASLEEKLHMNNPSITDTIMFCVRHYTANSESMR